MRGSVFEGRYLGDAVSHRTTVIVTGDAAGELPRRQRRRLRPARPARPPCLLAQSGAAGERGEDDSLIEVYRPHCAGVFEVRTVRQLADVIAQLM